MSATPALEMVKGYFDGFQYCDTTSGSVAAPTSPMPAARASGAMVCEVTEVLTGLNMSSFWAMAVTETSESVNKMDSPLIFIF